MTMMATRMTMIAIATSSEIHHWEKVCCRWCGSFHTQARPDTCRSPSAVLSAGAPARSPFADITLSAASVRININAAAGGCRCNCSFPQKVTLGFSVRLQAPSRRKSFATNLLRYSAPAARRQAAFPLSGKHDDLSN